jgi:hypothetical protein
MSQAMTDPLKRSQRDPVLVGCQVFARLVVVLALVMGIPAIIKSREIARDSAHSALWHEVNQQLKARESMGEFPVGPEELPLTYPDGGSPEILNLIDYRREGAECRVSTTLRGEKLERRYGQREG